MSWLCGLSSQSPHFFLEMFYISFFVSQIYGFRDLQRRMVSAFVCRSEDSKCCSACGVRHRLWSDLLLHHREDHGHKNRVASNKAFSFMRPINTMGFLLAYYVDELINFSSGANMSYWAAWYVSYWNQSTQLDATSPFMPFHICISETTSSCWDSLQEFLLTKAT